MIRTPLILKALAFNTLALFALAPAQAATQIGEDSGRVEWNGWKLDYDMFQLSDGLTLKNVTYNGVQILARANFPVMSVYYDGPCGPYADRLNGPKRTVPWANNATLVAREFTQAGKQWYELGIREFIGSYDIYQAWYISADGELDGHLFSRGLQCNYFHEHYPMWRLDFDIDGQGNDQIVRENEAGQRIPYNTEFQANATAAYQHRWFIEDTVTGHQVRIDFDSGAWNVGGEVSPVEAYNQNRVGGVVARSGEEGWQGGASRDFPYRSEESLVGADIAMWYRGYLPHSPEEGSELWHSTGFRISANLADDTDGDGLVNSVDPDDDNDGVDDEQDAFPLDASESVDTDSDGVGNNADTDDDADGVADSSDAFPLNPDEWADTDGDGTGNNTDTDDDGDGVSDVLDAFPLNADESVDTDGDGIGNNADTDDDNDGTPDDQDPAPLDPNIGGGNVLVIDKSVASRSDDAEQQGSGTVLLSSSDLELVFAGGSNQVVGMRFNGVGVPQGAEIVNAYIQFQTDEATSVTTNLNITGEATDNARAYQSATNDISSRSGTASSVAWSPAPWDQVGEAGLDQRTPNIGQVIQEIVSRPGWDAGNSLAVMIDGTGDRVAESFDGDSSGAPRLHIEFVNDDVGGTDTDNDGLPDSIDPDDDDDGVLDVNDDFPLDASEQTDTDGDGIGNNADTDDDNDGTPDDQDPAPLDPSIPGNGTISTDATVASRSDDAEQQGAGSVLLNSRDLELVFAAGADQTVGLRFNAVDVPQGAQIVNAYVQFQTDEATSVTTSLNITGEATDNAQTYQATTNNISSRPRTPSVVAWSPVPWNQIGQAGPDQRTPNINQVIQEIVARPGWSAGNSLAIMIDGTGDRVAMAFDGSATGAPRLHIDYVAGGGSSVAEKRIALSGDDVEETSTGAVKFRSSDLEMTSEATQQTIGLRFAGMEIPAGATITRAYVQFQVDARSSITTDLLFQGEDTDNAPPFLSASGNVSTRALTSAAIPWSVLPWNTVGAAGPAQRTPNLAPVIQELVDRAGWSAGNAVVLVVTGTGKRTAEAFDGADGGAPLLHVEFQ